MKKFIAFTFIISAFLIAGCQNQTTPGSTNTEGRPTQKSTEIIVPTLKLQQDNQQSNFQLRSQTSTYLNKDKSKVELTLTDNPTHSCMSPATTVSDNQTIYKLTIETDDGKVFTQGSAYTKLTLSKITATGEENIALGPDSKVKISAINSSIFRGDLSLVADNFSMQGEFFTALCK